MRIDTPTLIPAGTWNVDPSHSKLGFALKHMGFATVRGEFAEFEGAIEVGEDLSSAKAYGVAKVASIDTSDDKRDAHLRSPDFFDVEQHPEMTFTSTRVEHAGDAELHITGDLTLRGVTKEITLIATVLGSDQDPWGGERVGVEVVGELSRGDYGMTFNQVLGSGNMLVADKVKLALDIEAVKQS